MTTVPVDVGVDVEASEPPTLMASGVHHLSSIPPGPEVNPTHSVRSQTVDRPAQAAATFVDGSDPFFSMYDEMAAERERRVAENWRSDADNTVVVNGLFSVLVAILLGMSYQNASVFYLSQISQLQLLASLNGTSTPVLSQISDPSAFTFTVWTTTSWSMSLVISLFCTVIATLLRQCARRYLQITQEPRGARNRARVCELVAQGVEIKQLQRMSVVLVGLFHLSVGLFLSGFIYAINYGVAFWGTLSVALIFVVFYTFVSFAPLSTRYHISHTPFSSLVWFCWSRFVLLTYSLLYNSSLRLPFIRYRTQQRLWELARARLGWIIRGTKVIMEDLARKCSSSLDTSAVSRVFNSLDGHEDMEQFLSTIPGFYHSGEVNKDSSVLEGLSDKILAPAIVSFMDRSLSSNLLTAPKKQQRIKICLQAMDADPFLLQCTFGEILQNLNSDIFGSIAFVGLALEYLRKDDSNPWVKDFAQCILAVAVNHVRLDDGTWNDIVDHYLKPQHAQYLREDHNLRLCNLIYLIRQLKDSRLENSNQFERGGVWSNVLLEALKFEIRKPAYDLQLEFHALLDELRSIASGREQSSEVARSNAGLVLSCIYTAFVQLHEAIPAVQGQSRSYPEPVLIAHEDHWVHGVLQPEGSRESWSNISHVSQQSRENQVRIGEAPDSGLGDSLA